MIGRARWFVLLLMLWPLLGLAQFDDPAPGAGLPAMPAVPVPADPDTVAVRLEFPEDRPLPVAVSLARDTLLMGQETLLTLDFDPTVLPDEPLFLLDGLEFSQTWLAWNGTATVDPAQPGRLSLPVRIYQINPFRVEVGQAATGVYLVNLRTEGTQETATIRDPRRWGWNLLTILTAAVVLTLLVLLAWWAWTARKVATEEISDWAVPVPGWIPAAVDLENLLETGLLERGDFRAFLDRLAGICRHYLAVRFGIRAVEMTPPEIRSACRSLAQPAALTDSFLDILEGLDSRRYDPQPADPEYCRHTAYRFQTAMEAARILPRFTPVPAEDLLRGEKAWAHNETTLAAYNVPPSATYAPPGEKGDS
jgi:hypothetical protein